MFGKGGAGVGIDTGLRLLHASGRASFRLSNLSPWHVTYVTSRCNQLRVIHVTLRGEWYHSILVYIETE